MTIREKFVKKQLIPVSSARLTKKYMGSRRLAEIKAELQRLAGAKTAGLEAEIAAAQAALGAPFVADATRDILAARREQTAALERSLGAQEGLNQSVGKIASGFKDVQNGLEGSGISPDEVDAAVNTTFGIAAQTGQFILDPETGTLIFGKKTGKLLPAMGGLAGVLKPGEVVSPSEIAARLKIQPPSASHLLRRTLEAASGVIESAGRGKYRRNPKLVILGEKPSASVPKALEDRLEPTPAGDEEQRFWGAQIVAGLKNVGTGTLRTMEQAGVLKQGEHFEVTGSGKRVYRSAAKGIVRELDEAAAAAPIGRITSEFVSKTFGPPPEVKSTDQPAWENPYGPNGPRAANNDLVEFVIAKAINDCLRPDESHPARLTPLEIKTGRPPTEQTIRLAGEVATRLIVLEAQLGLGEEETGGGKLYPHEYEALELPEGGKADANRLAAATIMELAQKPRQFNFIRSKRPTYEHALAMVKGLKLIGRPDLIEAMAQNLANPKSITGQGTWSGGVTTLNHSSALG